METVGVQIATVVLGVIQLLMLIGVWARIFLNWPNYHQASLAQIRAASGAVAQRLDRIIVLLEYQAGLQAPSVPGANAAAMAADVAAALEQDRQAHDDLAESLGRLNPKRRK
jgi:hypothetical protein